MIRDGKRVLELLATGSVWTCPSCGPVTDEPFFDGDMHCPHEGCDAVLTLGH